jgi:hypothetical protein
MLQQDYNNFERGEGGGGREGHELKLEGSNIKKITTQGGTKRNQEPRTKR